MISTHTNYIRLQAEHKKSHISLFSWWKIQSRQWIGYFCFVFNFGRFDSTNILDWPCHTSHGEHIYTDCMIQRHNGTERNGTPMYINAQCKQRIWYFQEVLCLWHQTPLTLALALSHHGISMLICYWIIHNFCFRLNSYSWLLLVVFFFWIRNGPSK